MQIALPGASRNFLSKVRECGVGGGSVILAYIMKSFHGSSLPPPPHPTKGALIQFILDVFRVIIISTQLFTTSGNPGNSRLTLSLETSRTFTEFNNIGKINMLPKVLATKEKSTKYSKSFPLRGFRPPRNQLDGLLRATA